MTNWRECHTTDALFKRKVVERLKKARSEGVSSGKIAKKSGEGLSIHTIYDILEAKAFPMEIWEAVDEGLRELGY